MGHVAFCCSYQALCTVTFTLEVGSIHDDTMKYVAANDRRYPPACQYLWPLASRQPVLLVQLSLTAKSLLAFCIAIAAVMLSHHLMRTVYQLHAVNFPNGCAETVLRVCTCTPVCKCCSSSAKLLQPQMQRYFRLSLLHKHFSSVCAMFRQPTKTEYACIHNEQRINGYQ